MQERPNTVVFVHYQFDFQCAVLIEQAKLHEFCNVGPTEWLISAHVELLLVKAYTSVR